MTKGKKLLVIVVTDHTMLEWDEVKALQKKGHEVVTRSSDVFPHLTMGPECHMMDETLRKYVPLAVKEAQERVYGGKGVKHGVEDQEVVPEAGPAPVEGDTGEAEQSTGQTGREGGR